MAAEWRLLSKEEVEALDKKEIVVAKVASQAEVESQLCIRCTSCGVQLNVQGLPRIVRCPNCMNTFRVSWL